MSSNNLVPLKVQLQSWDKYISEATNTGKSKVAGLPTFYARFQLASNFEGMSVVGMAEPTVAIYSRVTRIGLSYSALECLERLITLKDYPPILAADIAATMRQPEFKPLIDSALKGFRSQAVKRELGLVLDNHAICNIRPFVMLFRNSLFHGEFTPGGWNAKPNRAMYKLLDSLSQVTLRVADQTFTSWFKSQKS